MLSKPFPLITSFSQIWFLQSFSFFCFNIPLYKIHSWFFSPTILKFEVKPIIYKAGRSKHTYIRLKTKSCSHFLKNCVLDLSSFTTELQQQQYGFLPPLFYCARHTIHSSLVKAIIVSVQSFAQRCTVLFNFFSRIF